MTSIRRSGLTRTNTPFEYTPDKIQNSCKNVNITSVLNPSFHGTKKGTTADIIRPEFKQGISSLKLPTHREADIKNKRSGLGNNLIIRPNFAAPSVPPRQVVDYLLQAKLEAQQGVKVTLGDSTFTKLFEITTGDPLDVEWIAEYKRLKALGRTDEELATNPPLGRPQRVMKKMVNFAEATNLANKSSLGTTELLKTIRASIAASASSMEVKEALAKIMQLSEDLTTFSEENKLLFSEILDKIGVPQDPKLFFSGNYHRLWSAEEVRNNVATVSTFLSSNVNKNPKFPRLTPIKIYISAEDSSANDWKNLQIELAKGGGDARGKVFVYSADGEVQDHSLYKGYEFFLDVETRETITRDQAVALANSGVDNGFLDGVPAPTRADGSAGYWLTDAETKLVIP